MLRGQVVVPVLLKAGRGKDGDEPLKPIGDNFYTNAALINGSDIVQDVPTGTLPDDHNLVFNTSDPCNATYQDLGDGTFNYIFNPEMAVVRLALQNTVGGFDEGKTYRYQVMVRTKNDNPAAIVERAIHIAAMVNMEFVDTDHASMRQNSDFYLRWIDFKATGDNARGNFRHGAGVWNTTPTEWEYKDIAIYELEEFGDNLIDFSAPIEVGDGWTDNLDGTYTCDGTNVADSDITFTLPAHKTGRSISSITIANYNEGEIWFGRNGGVLPASQSNGKKGFEGETTGAAGTFIVRAVAGTRLTVSLGSFEAEI